MSSETPALNCSCKWLIAAFPVFAVLKPEQEAQTTIATDARRNRSGGNISASRPVTLAVREIDCPPPAADSGCDLRECVVQPTGAIVRSRNPRGNANFGYSYAVPPPSSPVLA